MKMYKLSAGTRGHFRRDGRAKVAYETEELAAVVASSAQHAYRCKFCKRWHVGSKAQP